MSDPFLPKPEPKKVRAKGKAKVAAELSTGAAVIPPVVDAPVLDELPVAAADEPAHMQPQDQPAAPADLPEGPKAPGLDQVIEAAIAPVIHQTIAEGKPVMATTAETVTNNFATAGYANAEKAQAFFGDFSERAKASFEKSTRFYEELGELAKGNVEAFVASSRIAAKGAETLGQDAAAYGKSSLESATAAFRGMASVKSPTELFQLQSDYARSSFDAAVAETSKASEQMIKLMGDVFQPISTRFAVAAEKVKSAAL